MEPLPYLTFLITLLVSAQGHSDGPPIKVCKRLTPGHPQISYKGKSATLTHEKLDSGLLRVQIQSDEPFKGFILQGRIKNDEGNGDAIGLFNESPDFTYKLMKCFRSLGNTISHHEANKNKTVIVADWDPQGYTGAMEFKSVVVYEYDFGQKLAIDLDV